MSEFALRFLHASDFHLEASLGGVAEIPRGWRDLFLEAAYRSVEQVFETALMENVDGVLLSGDLVDLERAGPRAAVFLHRQFQRLADRGIAVYWAGGVADPPDAWPPSMPLPANVHVFSAGRCESLEHRRQGATVARIQGISRAAGLPPDDRGFFRDAGGLFTIGVAHGTSASPGAEGDRVHYMALGGQHRRQTVDQSPGVAHFAGTPQGRRPAETGAHGCTLLTVDEAGNVKLRFVPTDAVRWVAETLELTEGTSEDDLLGLIRERAIKVRGNHPDRDLLVTWRAEGASDLLNALRRGGLADALVARLREEEPSGPHRLWHVAIECDQPGVYPEAWYDQETILGDMLRQFRELAADAAEPLELADFLPEGRREEDFAGLAEAGPHERDALLQRAAKLGLELLSVEDDA